MSISELEIKIKATKQNIIRNILKTIYKKNSQRKKLSPLNAQCPLKEIIPIN